MKFILMICCIVFLWNIMIILNRKGKELKIKNIKSFNLGSSHSLCAFDNSLKNNINLAENSQTFYYDYKLLNKYFDRIENNAICFITISYFSFAPMKYWLNTDVLKYYKTLGISDFNGKFKVECIIYKYFPLIWSIYKKFIREKKIDILKKYDGHVKKLEENRNLNYNLEILKNIIKKCNEKSIKVIFITTPFMKEYNNYFNEKLLKSNFYNIIEEIISQYNIKYFDFSHDYINFDNNKYFKDYDHLSLEGSKKFIEVLLKKLRGR